MVDLIAQVVIVVCGVTAVYLSQDPRPNLRRWAPVLGLIGQPAWFATAIINEQWGLLAIAVLYTYSWARGFIIQWRPQ